MNAPVSDLFPVALDARYDRITRVAAAALITPISLLSLRNKEDGSMRLGSVFGIDAAGANALSTELGLLHYPLAVADARRDARFHDAVAGCSMGAVAYCNALLLDADGNTYGSLCVIDTRPRPWSAQEIEILQDIAQMAVSFGMHAAPLESLSKPVGLAYEAASLSGMPAWFVHHATLGMAMVDAGTRCLWANAAFEQILGLPLQAMRDRRLGELFGSLQAEGAVGLALTEVLSTHQHQVIELCAPAANYELERYLSVSIYPVERNGEVPGAGIYVSEISDRRRRERDVRLAEDRLPLACEAANIGLWFWDLDTNRLEWSERCRGIFGLSRSEKVDYQVFSNLVHPDDRHALETAVQDALAGQADYHALFRVVLADGRMRWIDARGRTFAGPQGEPVCFMGAMVDVTDIKSSETSLQVRSETLLELNDNLAELVDARTAELQLLSRALIELAEQEKAQLARELHDELGAHLTVAHMEIAAALRRLPDKQGDVAGHLLRARATILETTSLKRRIIEGLRPSLIESLGVVEALRELVEKYSSGANIRCTAEMPEDLPDLGTDMSIALYRIAQESLTNIAKYAQASEVQVRLMRMDGNVVLEVCDNGRGLLEDFRKRVTTHGISGMQQRAAHFKGVFSIMNRTDGPGTRVTVVMPLAD